MTAKPGDRVSSQSLVSAVEISCTSEVVHWS